VERAAGGVNQGSQGDQEKNSQLADQRLAASTADDHQAGDNDQMFG
jgi:hypothetical protein